MLVPSQALALHNSIFLVATYPNSGFVRFSKNTDNCPGKRFILLTKSTMYLHNRVTNEDVPAEIIEISVSNLKKIMKYTLEELADAHIIPAKLTPEEKAAADVEMKAFRFRILEEMTVQERLECDLFRLNVLMRRYLQKSEYLPTYRFEACLQEYLKLLGKKPAVFAQEIQLALPKLKVYLLGKEHPNLAVLYRLEKHSGGLIPALLWWQITARQIEQEIQQDTENRQREAAKVKFVS
jgi:hypothetical protein